MLALLWLMAGIGWRWLLLSGVWWWWLAPHGVGRGSTPLVLEIGRVVLPVGCCVVALIGVGLCWSFVGGGGGV